VTRAANLMASGAKAPRIKKIVLSRYGLVEKPPSLPSVACGMKGLPPLHFVRCGGKLLQCGNATFVVLLPPTLGVSSLDLGRLQPRAALFSCRFEAPSKAVLALASRDVEQGWLATSITEDVRAVRRAAM
jgi:hypothetical protein